MSVSIRLALICALAALSPDAVLADACGDQSHLPADERITNAPRWRTASESGNFGFDVFRGDSEDGPFERINEDTILGAGDADEPNDYRYVDDSIDPCRDYWYYVESISLSGERERFTPTFRAPAKRQPSAD